MEGINIGSLYLSLGLDPTSYHQNLQAARQEAMKVGAEIEKNLNLGLKPKVDHTELYALNKHLDLKQKHAQELNRYFQQNPLKPRVDTSEIDLATQKLNEFKRSISDIKSQAGTKIQVQAEHRINTSDLDRSFRSATNQFERSGRNIGDEIAKRVSKAEVKIKAPLGGGLVGGVLQGVTMSIGNKIAAGTSQRFDQALGSFGRNAERYITSRVGRAAVGVSRDLGYRNTQEFRRDIRRVGGYVDEFIDPRKSRKKAVQVEQSLSKAAADYFVERKPIGQVVRQFASEVAAPSKGTQEAGLRLAGFGLRQVSPLLRINKDVNLARAAKDAEAIAANLEVSEAALKEMEKSNAVVFAIGGLHNAGGKGGAEILKPQLQRLAPGAYVQGVSNAYRDSTSQKPEGINNVLGKIKPGLTVDALLKKAGLENQVPPDYLKFLDTAMFSGATPDVVKAAAQIKALKNKGFEKPIYSVGYSSGGSDAADLVALTEKMGIPIKGVGIGSPMTGLASRPNPNFTSILGDKDFIYQSLFGGKAAGSKTLKALGVTDLEKADVFTKFQVSGLANRVLGKPQGQVAAGAGQFHKFNDYIASQNVQEMLRQQFPGIIPSVVPPSLRNESSKEGTRGFDFILQQSEGKLDKELDKIQNARRNPMTIGKTIKDLEKTQKEYRDRYKVTTGSVKEELDAFLETLQHGITALTVLQESHGMPSAKYKKVIGEMERAGAKYYQLADNNRRLQQERFYAGQPLEEEPVPPGEIVKPGDKAKSLLRRVAAGAGNLTNAGAIALMNRKLGTIDAFQNQGVAPKIASFKDLSMRGYMEIAKQDMGSVLKTLQGSVGKGYAIAKGVENFALDALPFGHTAKGVVQNVALPAVAFNAATHMLPGGAAMGHAATDAVSHALQLPMGAVGEATTMAVNNALTGAIEQIPMIGHKLAPALAQGISGLISGAVETASSTIAGAATPVLGGQAMLSPVKAIGSAVVGNQDPLIAETQRKLKVLNAGVNQARNLLSPRPEQAGLYIDGIQQDIKVIGAQVDQAIAALPPENRMSEGAQIANLKSQVAKTENKLNTLIQALKQVATNPGQVIDQSVHGEVIDAEVVPERLALKSAAVPQLRPGVTPQRSIKELGSSFTAQIQSAKGLNNPGIAAEVLASATEARNAIDALVKATGGNATKEFNKIVSTARGQITKAEKSAKQIVAEAQSAGVNVSVGFNQGLTSSIDQVKGAANHLAEAGIEEIKDVWDIHSPSRVGIWLGRMFGLGVQEGVESVSTGSVFQNFASESANALKGIIQNVKNAVNGVPALKNAIGIAVGAFAGFQALQFAAPILGQLKEMSQALINAALDSEALARSFALIGGGAEKGTAKMNEIAESSDQMGVNAKKAQEGYIQLAASTRETPLEGYATDQIASGLTKASSAYNLNPERQDLVNTAISQMAGKGVVSMEELRGQLSESLPGAMQIAARAMDMTTAEFTKFVASGNLASEDFLPRFAQQLKAELAVTAESSSKSAQSSFNRLDNALNRLQVTMGKLSLPVEVFRADILTKGLNLLEANMGTVMRTSTALAIVLLGIDKAFVSGSKSALRFAMSMNFAEAAGGLQKLSQGIQGVIGSFSGLIGRVAAVATVIAVASAAFELLKDRGGEFRDVADSNRKSLEEMQKTLGIPIDKKSDGLFGFFEYLKDSIPVIGSIAGMFEKLQSSLSGIKVPEPVKQLFQAVGQPFGLGQGGIIDAYKKTMADKEKYDQNKAVAEVRQTSQRGASIAASFAQNTGLVQRNKDLEAQIDDVQLRQRVLRQNNPNDSMGLTALRQEEAEIRKRGSSTLNQVAAIRSQLNKNVEDIRATISALEKKPGNESQIAQLKQDLQAAEQAQADFSRATQPAIANLERMARLWKQVADRIEDAVAAGKQTQNMANVQVSEAQLTGAITPGQASGQKSLIEQSRMMSEMTQKYAALNNLKARVNPDSAKVLGAYGLTNAGAAELSTQAEASQNPKEKQIFQQAAQLKQLESQVTQLQDDLTNSAAQMSQQLQDAAKTVQDFYRGIQRQSEDVALTVKSSNLEIAMMDVKRRVSIAISGFQSTFVDEFANGLIEVFSKWNESLQVGVDAQRQILQLTRGFQDQQLQALETYKNLPGAGGMAANVPGGFVGGDYKTIATGTLAAQEYGASRPGRKHAGQDLDLGDNDSFQSYIGGMVTQTGNDPGGYYHWIDIFNDRLKKVERIAELDNVMAKVGDVIQPGQVVGQGTRSTGVVHYEIRNDFDAQGRGGFGYGGTQDPVAFLEGLGLVKRQGTSLTPTGKGVSQRASIAEDDHRSGGGGMPSSLNTFGFDQNKVAQGIAFYLSQGFSKRAAAYMVGNFMQESSLDPRADNGSHRGLAQWDANRSQGMPSDYHGQLQFSIQDLMRDSPSSLATFKNPNASDSQIMSAISQWERYGSGEEASRFKYGKGLADQLGRGGDAMPMAPTTGMTNQELQNRETFAQFNSEAKARMDQGLGIAGKATQDGIDSVQAVAQAKQANLSQEAQSQLNRLTKTFVQSAEDQTREYRQRSRKQEDIQLNLGADTPAKTRRRQEIQIQRDYEDNAIDFNRATEKLNQSKEQIDALQKFLKEGDQTGLFAGHEGDRKKIVDSIAKARVEVNRASAEANKIRQQMPANYQAQLKDVQEKYQIEYQSDRVSARKEANSLRDQLNQLKATKFDRDSLEFNPNYDPVKSAAIKRDQGLQSVEADMADQMNQLEQKKRGEKLISTEYEDQKRLIGEIADLRREDLQTTFAMVQAQEQARKESEAIANRNQLFESYKNLGAEQGQSYKVYGLDTQANDFDKEMALAQQRFDFANQNREIDEAAKKSKEFAAISGELKQNLENLNKVKLDNIQKQFDPLTQVITSTKDSFQNFFGSILSGSKGLGEAFRDLISSIGQNLANMASKMLTDQLFGALMGGKSFKDSAAQSKATLGGISPLQTYGGFGDDAGKLLAVSVADSGQQFLGLSQQAGEAIVAAAQQFAQIVNSGSAIGMDGSLPTSAFGMKGFGNEMGDLSSLDRYVNIGKDISSSLFDGAENASFSIQNGVTIASDLLAQSGAASSDNLLGGLSKGLPSIIQNVVGLFGSGGGGSGGIFGSILGIAGSLLGGGLFGGGGGGGIPVADVVSVFGGGFAKGGIVGATGLDKALQKEAMMSGGRPVLATLTEGEMVLTRAQARKYQEMGLDKLVGNNIQSFARGGSVGNAPTFNASSFRSSNVSIDIPITVNQDSGNKDGVDVAALKKELELKVREVIIKEQRPKGLLS